MCYIWCGIFPLDFTTTIDIVPPGACPGGRAQIEKQKKKKKRHQSKF